MNPEPIARIPNEILEIIFSHLNGNDLKRVTLVNKRFLLLISDSPILMRKWMFRIHRRTTVAKNFPIRKYQVIKIDTDMEWLNYTRVPWRVIFPNIQALFDLDYGDYNQRSIEDWTSDKLKEYFPNIQKVKIVRSGVILRFQKEKNEFIWYLDFIPK
jgi:hypothetical protein